MKGFTITITSLCILTTIACGCATRSFRHNAISDEAKAGSEPLGPSTLSEYIRAVYKLSGESVNKQNDQRVQLLAQLPELAELAARIDRNAEDREARSQLASAFIDHQLYWPAYELLTATPMADDDREANRNFARIWDVWGQYDLALKYSQRVIAAGDTSSGAYELMGRIYLHRGEPEQATTWYTRAAQQSNNPTVLANLGYTYILLSDWDNAKSNLEKSIKLDSTLPEPHNNLAFVLMKLGDDNGALSELLKTAQAHVAFNNLGVFYLQEHKLDRAQEFFEEALRLEPRYDIAQRNLTTVQALLPAPAIPEASIGNSLQETKQNVNVNCPVADESKPALVQTDGASTDPERMPTTAIDVDFIGSRGVVETDVMPSDQQSVSQPAPADAATLRLQIKRPAAIEQIKHTAYEKVRGKAKDARHISDQATSAPATVNAGEVQGNKSASTGDRMATAFESNGAACTYSRARNAHHNNWRSMFELDHQQLSVCGIIALLLCTAGVAVRRNKPGLIAKVILR